MATAYPAHCSDQRKNEVMRQKDVLRGIEVQVHHVLRILNVICHGLRGQFQRLPTFPNAHVPTRLLCVCVALTCIPTIVLCDEVLRYQGGSLLWISVGIFSHCLICVTSSSCVSNPQCSLLWLTQRSLLWLISSSCILNPQCSMLWLACIGFRCHHDCAHVPA